MLAFLWSLMAFYGLLWQNIDFIGLVWSFFAVIDPNSFGLVQIAQRNYEFKCTYRKLNSTQTETFCLLWCSDLYFQARSD